MRWRWGVRLPQIGNAALAALLAFSVLIVVPPSAVADPPADTSTWAITVSARDRQAIASWPSTGAPGYLVELSGPGNTNGPTRIPTASNMVVLDALSPNTRYQLRVVESGAARSGIALDLTTTFTTKPPAFPRPAPLLSAESGTSESLSLSWSSPAKGFHFEVQTDSDDVFSNPSSTVVKDSDHRVTGLKADHQYSARVRLVDDQGQPASDWSVPVSAETLSQRPLRVASFNIRKWTQANWSKRRHAVAETILDQQVEVVGLQEATPSHVPWGPRQFNDVVNLLGSDWALTDARGGSTGETRIIYNKSRLTLIEHGYQKLAGSTRFGVARYGAWAILEQHSTGKRFLFVNTHLPYQKSAKARAYRTAAARQLTAMIERVNTDQLPVVMVGDFNSHGHRNSSNGVYRTILASGLIDPLVARSGKGSAEKRENVTLKTVNKMSRKAPRRSSPPLIDHIFVSPMRVAEWETVAKLDSSGRWIGTIPSDHNMVRATIYLP